jgi:hypothetical protein
VAILMYCGSSRSSPTAWQGLQWFKVQCAGWMGEWGDYDWTSFGHCSQQPCDLCCLCKRAWPSRRWGMETFLEPC